VLRLYLRSHQESDEVRARDLCEQYGLDFAEAQRLAREGT